MTRGGPDEEPDDVLEQLAPTAKSLLREAVGFGVDRDVVDNALGELDAMATTIASQSAVLAVIHAVLVDIKTD